MTKKELYALRRSQGICVSGCGRKTDGKVTCVVCRERARERVVTRVQVEGRCVACGEPRAPGDCRCLVCIAKGKAYREGLKERGLCVACQRPMDRVGSYCLACCAKAKAKREAAVASGMCRNCRRPNPIGGKHCPECRQKNSRKRKATAKSGICYLCRGPLDTKSEICSNCTAVRVAGRADKTKRIRAEVFTAYGGFICACCGETEPRLLELDHKNNDGRSHRKELKASGNHVGHRYYVWIKENNFPPIYRVLCCNCNKGRQLNGGTCPHQQEEEEFFQAFTEAHQDLVNALAS